MGEPLIKYGAGFPPSPVKPKPEIDEDPVRCCASRSCWRGRRRAMTAPEATARNSL
jgi:hypothetical protein